MNTIDFAANPQKICEFQRRAMISFLLFLALVSAAFSVVGTAYYIHHDQTWARISGKITSVTWTKERQSGRSSRQVFAVTYGYEAETPEGKFISGRAYFKDFNGVPVKRGQSVEVLYARDDPSNHETIHEHRKLLKYSIMFGFLCPVLLVGARLTRRYGKKRM